MIYFSFITLFLFLLLLNYHLTRSGLAPPVLFTAVWITALLGIALSGDALYPVSWPALTVYFTGALAFSFGGIFGQSLGQEDRVNASREREILDSSKEFRHFVMDAILLILLVGLPIYWRQAVSEFGEISGITLATIRAQEIELSEQTRTFTLLRNFPVISGFLAAALSYENDGTFSRGWRAYLSIALAIVYGSIVGTKMTVVIVPLIIFFIACLRARKILVGMALGVFLFVLAAFSAGLVVVNYAYQDLGTVPDMVHAIAATAWNYWLGGPVAFTRIVEDPQSIASTQQLSRFFLETANSLGANLDLPSLHADYTDISETQNSNVYTIYFTYYKDFGLSVSAVLMAGVGFVSGYVYGRAGSGLPIPVLLYALLAAATVLSIHAEHFIIGLNMYIKALLFFAFLYKVVPIAGLLVGDFIHGTVPRVKP